MEQLGYLTTFDRNLAHRCGGLITVVMKLAVKRDTESSHGSRFYLAQGVQKYRSFQKKKPKQKMAVGLIKQHTDQEGCFVSVFRKKGHIL